MNKILKKIQMLIRKGLFFIFVGFICITACGCGSGEISLYEDMEAVSSNQSTETGDEDDSETVDSDDSETANLDISSEKVGNYRQLGTYSYSQTICHKYRQFLAQSFPKRGC